jgi:hypothetical protein
MTPEDPHGFLAKMWVVVVVGYTAEREMNFVGRDLVKVVGKMAMVAAVAASYCSSYSTS